MVPPAPNPPAVQINNQHQCRYDGHHLVTLLEIKKNNHRPDPQENYRMLGIFKTKPPLVPIEKAWTEDRMNWLASHFGAHRLLETPTLTPDYNGIPSVTNYDEANDLLDFLRTWMKIKVPNVRLQIHSDIVSPDMMSTPDGAENPTIVNIREADFEHRDTLIASLSRGLAYEAISEHGLADQLVGDGGWTVELLPAYLGLGAFAANATVDEETSTDGTYFSWSMSRRGVLPSRIFGYAMALRTFARGDEAFDWSQLLRQDARTAVDNGMKFLTKVGDTTFTRESLDQSRDTISAQQLVGDLSDGSPSRKINAMLDLSKRIQMKTWEPNEEAGRQVLQCVSHRDPNVRAVGVSVLPGFVRSQEAVLEVCDALSDPKPDVRSDAARAAGAMAGIDDEPLVESLIEALRDESKDVVVNIATSLTQFGSAGEPATKAIIKGLHRAFVDCRDEDGLRFANTLLAITPGSVDDARALFDDSEAEFRGYACGVINQLTDGPDENTA